MAELEFRLLSEILWESGCQKRAVAAGTWVDGSFVRFVNRCLGARAALSCPRQGFPDEDSPEALAACDSQHAEQELAKELTRRGARSQGIAWVLGHYYACRACAQALREVGVVEIRVRNSLAGLDSEAFHGCIR